MNIPLCVKDSSVRILFTEGRDRRMMEAAIRLYNEQILTPLLYGDTRQLYEQAEAYGLSLTGIQIVDPKRFTQREDMIRRMHRQAEIAEALGLLDDAPNQKNGDDIS